jgi:PAS domain S-box-containing protein
MTGLTNWLFNPSGLSAHGFCLLWEPGLIWLHALADAGIGLSYYAIPMILAVIIRRRPDLVFRPVAALFAAFILLCGTGHWLDLLTLWIPAYGAEGVVKGMTAITSIGTAVALWRLLPQALVLPSPAQMRRTQADLLAVQEAEQRIAVIAADTAEMRDALARELLRREATEAALRESEGRFRILLESDLTEAIYLMDPRGTIETWNAGAERIKGYRPADVIGRNYAMFFTAGDKAKDEPARALAFASANGHFASTGWRVRKDGVPFLASVAIDAVHHDDGTLRGFVKVTVDLTQQRIEAVERLIIIEAAPAGLMTIDEAGVIMVANSALERIFGYPAGGLMGVRAGTLVPEGLSVAQDEPDHPMDIDIGVAADRQLTGVRRDGTPVPVELKLSTVKTPRGTIIVASVADITIRLREEAERQEAERAERQSIEQANANLDRLARHLAKARDRAEQANRAKSNFLAGMSHELRTPLNAILGYADLLKMDGGFTEQQAARLGSMQAASRHLLEMIACVLDLSEIEADHVTLRPADIDARATGLACLDLVRPSAEAKNLALGLTVAAGTRCNMLIDPTRFRQVLVNLLGNAVKFTQHGSVGLHLQASEDGGSLGIEIRDTGPGIAAEHRDRLFQNFERLGMPGEIEGTGLGLALSFSLAKLLGGELGYRDNPGGGSVFRLQLPVSSKRFDAAARDDLDGGAAPEPEPEAEPPLALRVLVTDDVLINRDIAECFLRTAGHIVTSVESGAEAVSAVANADFDIVLMDIRMPGMDGLEATRRIRNLDGAKGLVPIVGLTAYAFTEQVAQCKAAGMDDHLAKPFKPEALVEIVSRVAASSRRRLKARNLAQASVGDSEQSRLSSARPEKMLPVLDETVFRRTCAALEQGSVLLYLEKISSMGSALIDGLRLPAGEAARGRDLADAAHALAGSAGMFGFVQLASVGCDFEIASGKDAPELPRLAEQLCRSIVTAQNEIQSRMPPSMSE